MDKSLLPANATATERALSLAMGRLCEVALPIRASWDPASCPAHLLPWLAWAFSVDSWQADWQEWEKRAAIQHAFYLHRKKGTLAALERAVAPLGYQITITEWFEREPPGVPYTFDVEATIWGESVSEAARPELMAILNANKNVRSQIQHLTVKANELARAYVRIGAGQTSWLQTTIYPSNARVRTSSFYWAMGQQVVDELSVYPPSYTEGGGLSWLWRWFS